MIITILKWWFVSSLLGALAFPIAWRLFSRLPDRGYGLSRILGLLFTGYVFWLGGTFSLVGNNAGGAFTAVLVLLGLSLWSVWGSWGDLRQWLRDHWRTLLVIELLFLISFIGWAFVRANNPDIAGTEKPMELAFVNAILGSDTFPPKDPWLSGYAISYYYFGYILLALLTLLTGVNAGEAFNLGNALWFAFVVVGTYSIIYNLVAYNRGGKEKLGVPLLGPLFVLITGNLGGFLELLHARYVFWRMTPGGELVSPFWTWLGLDNLELPPNADISWIPTRHWWWWRASRVIRDRDLLGVPIGNQPIDEFPFFSFLLADNHPHLLAMPFVLLAIALALQVFLLGRRDGFRLGPLRKFPIWSRRAAFGAFILILFVAAISQGNIAGQESLSFGGALLSLLKSMTFVGIAFALIALLIAMLTGVLPSSLSRVELLFAAWLFGGLAFLNTWDFPIYLSLLLIVIAWASRWLPLSRAVMNILLTTLVVAVAGFLLYLPWYPSFSSQAGGILPHLMLPTRFVHFLVMFLVLLLPIIVWLIDRVRTKWQRGDLKRLLVIGVGVPFGLLIFSWLLAVVVGGSQYRIDPAAFEGLLGALGATDISTGISATIVSRITQSWTAILLGFLIGGAAVLLLRLLPPPQSEDPERPGAWVLITFFILIGALLIIAPEFVYLKDQFLLRMNTIFKFYFAAWILWGLAAAYATYEVWRKRGVWWTAAKIIITIPLLLGLLYPILSVWTKTSGFNPPFDRTLDGTEYIANTYPGDYDAIQWISENLGDGVIAEAIGGSYTYYGRVSVHTALSTVLGWPGHESQWRGGATEQGSRENDIRTLYMSMDWSQTENIIDNYGIDYVFVGSLERTLYGPVFEQKFDTYSDLIYENDQVRIYRVRSDS